MKIIKNKSHWFKIKTKSGEVVPFKLNKSQKRVLDIILTDIETKGQCRKILVKGRQKGISTLIEALLLSYAMTEPAFTGYCMAHDATTANDLFDKIIKFIWQNLNPELKEYYQVKRDNTRQIMFEGYMNSSSVTVGLSARGGTVDGLHISEAGKISMNPNLWQEMITGTFPASEKAKFIIIESTADGGLGEFYQMVQDSLAGKNDFETIFLSWTDAEEYQKDIPDNALDWKLGYAELARKLNLYQKPDELFGINDNQWYWYYKQAQTLKAEVKSQYPFTIDEAFISKSRNKFDVNTVKNLPIRSPLTILEGVKIFKEFQNNMVYSLGADTAKGGKNAGDYAAFTMREYYQNDKGEHEIVAQFKERLEPRAFASLIVRVANWYNEQGGKVFIAPEINYEGDNIITYLLEMYDKDLIYKRYITDETKQNDVLIPDYGWNTNVKTRTLIIDRFADGFRDGIYPVISKEEQEEMIDFVYKPSDKDPLRGRYEAQNRKHDDLLLSDFICVAGFDYIAKYG